MKKEGARLFLAPMDLLTLSKVTQDDRTLKEMTTIKRNRLWVAEKENLTLAKATKDDRLFLDFQEEYEKVAKTDDRDRLYLSLIVILQEKASVAMGCQHLRMTKRKTFRLFLTLAETVEEKSSVAKA